MVSSVTRVQTSDCSFVLLVDSFFVYDRFTFYRISVYSEKRFSEYGDLIIDIATE